LLLFAAGIKTILGLEAFATAGSGWGPVRFWPKGHQRYTVNDVRIGRASRKVVDYPIPFIAEMWAFIGFLQVYAAFLDFLVFSLEEPSSSITPRAIKIRPR
jgi:hypothetical protein